MNWFNKICERIFIFSFNFSIGWKTLRQLIENKFVKSISIWLVITPIAAKALANVTEVQIPGLAITIALELPFSWVYLFFASLFLTIANVIFRINCPNSINNYNSLQDFKNKDFTASMVHELFRTDLNRKQQAKFKNDPRMILRRDVVLKEQEQAPAIENPNGARKKMLEDFNENMMAHDEGSSLRIDELVDMKNIGYSFILIRRLCDFDLRFKRHTISFFAAGGYVAVSAVVCQNIAFVLSQMN